MAASNLTINRKQFKRFKADCLDAIEYDNISPMDKDFLDCLPEGSKEVFYILWQYKRPDHIKSQGFFVSWLLGKSCEDISQLKTRDIYLNAAIS